MDLWETKEVIFRDGPYLEVTFRERWTLFGGDLQYSLDCTCRYYCHYCRGISRKPADEEKSAKSGSWDTNNLKKEFKTIYDMISNLAGRPVPGIPLNGHLPSDPIERVKQIFWQHSTLLTFLR